MVYVIDWAVRVSWKGNGTGPIGPNAQSIRVNDLFGNNSGSVVVPGGDTPTGANLTTAATTVGTNIGTALNVAPTLATIQGFATGGN